MWAMSMWREVGVGREGTRTRGAQEKTREKKSKRKNKALSIEDRLSRNVIVCLLTLISMIK